MIKGINPKRWLYELRHELRRRPHNAWILAGAACEQWVNSELFRIVCGGLSGTPNAAYSEWNGRQHDIGIFRYEAGSDTAWKTPVAVIETKLVYLNHKPRARADALERLIEQLTVEHPSDPIRIGLFLGVHAYWKDEHPQGKPSFKAFRAEVGALLRKRVRQGTRRFLITAGHGGAMETILAVGESKIGPAKVVAGCIGQYIRVEQR